MRARRIISAAHQIAPDLLVDAVALLLGLEDAHELFGQRAEEVVLVRDLKVVQSGCRLGSPAFDLNTHVLEMSLLEGIS